MAISAGRKGPVYGGQANPIPQNPNLLSKPPKPIKAKAKRILIPEFQLSDIILIIASKLAIIPEQEVHEILGAGLGIGEVAG
jgi:hypothetical protein